MAPVEIETMYWLPHCTTCIKADQYLKDRGVSVKKHIDVKTERLSVAEVDHLVDLIGSAEALFSKRAMKYRSLGLDKRTLSDAGMRQYMHEEYTFIKRPVIVTKSGKILAGFSAKQYDALLKG